MKMERYKPEPEKYPEWVKRRYRKFQHYPVGYRSIETF